MLTLDGILDGYLIIKEAEHGHTKVIRPKISRPKMFPTTDFALTKFQKKIKGIFDSFWDSMHEE